ncbi:D-alanine--D-alanine ligase family protein [Elusimicrobiota bacterium]
MGATGIKRAVSSKLLVLCGGRSAERDVSCVSAAAIVRNLSPRYRPVLVRIDPEGRWHFQRDPSAFARHPSPFKYRFDRVPVRIEPGPRPALLVGPLGSAKRIFVDAVFPALHGPLGEDGTLQGLLEFHGLPYVGCDVLGSAVAMDKEMTKRLAGEAGLPLLPYAVLRSPTELGGARKLRFPVFVKPIRLGSSVGVYKVDHVAGLASAVRRAFRFDTTVVVEQGVPAREIECAVLGRTGRARSSIPGEIKPNADFYSYEAKYIDPDGAELIVPANLPARSVRRVQTLAVRAFETLGCYGMGRVDFLMDRRSGKLWFNEINTIPGFTAISMYPKLWGASGLPFPRLIDRLIDLAVARHRERSNLRQTRD